MKLTLMRFKLVRRYMLKRNYKTIRADALRTHEKSIALRERIATLTHTKWVRMPGGYYVLEEDD